MRTRRSVLAHSGWVLAQTEYPWEECQGKTREEKMPWKLAGLGGRLSQRGGTFKPMPCSGSLRRTRRTSAPVFRVLRRAVDWLTVSGCLCICMRRGTCMYAYICMCMCRGMCVCVSEAHTKCAPQKRPVAPTHKHNSLLHWSKNMWL